MEILAALFFLWLILLVAIVGIQVVFKIIEFTWNNAIIIALVIVLIMVLG